MAYRDEAAMAYRDEAAMALLDSRLEVLIAFLLKTRFEIQISNILLNTKTCISLVVELQYLQRQCFSMSCLTRTIPFVTQRHVLPERH